MRVWVVEDRRADAEGKLEALLRQLADQSRGEVCLVGAGPLAPATAGSLRAQAPDLLVVDGAAWPEAPWAEEVLALGAGVVVRTAPEDGPRFRRLAEQHPLVFVPAAAGPDALWLGLHGAWAARQRQQHWRTEVERLQQRLSDRIVIERAKGVLVQRLRISEEEAYNRLRVLSRRQRRPMRDIAQSFLDTQDLLTPGDGAVLEEGNGESSHDAGGTPLPR
jgi:AmiR/NasT family two-component response regulator